jgi:hypothetical protein
VSKLLTGTIWRLFNAKNMGLNTCKKIMFPDLSYLSDIGENKLLFDIFGELLFNVLLCANSSKTLNHFKLLKTFFFSSRGFKLKIKKLNDP